MNNPDSLPANVDASSFDLRKFKKLELPFVPYLQKGLTTKQITQLLQPTGLCLPQEVFDYFQWHNGLRADRPFDYEFFPQATPFSLEEAIEQSKRLCELDQEFAGDSLYPAIADLYQIFEYERSWHPTWLPLFWFQGDEFWFTICSEQSIQESPIYRFYLPGGLYLAYDSLMTLLTTVVESFEAGAFTIGERGSIQMSRPAALPIINRNNPRRQAYLLQQAGGAKNIADLIQSFSEPRKRNSDVFLALKLLGDEQVVQPITQLLQHRDWKIRKEAALLLGELGYSTAIDSLVQALKDRNEAVKIAAIYALGEIGDKQAIAPLSKLLNTMNPSIQQAVVSALKQLKQS